MGQKLRGLCPFWGELGSHLTQCHLGRAYLRTKWHLDQSSHFATIDMGWKFGGCAPFLEGVAGSPSKTKSPGPRPISIPSGILIHPAIWLQRTWANKWWGLCPFWRGELGPHVTHCGQGQGLPLCQVSSWSIQPFRHNTPTSQTRQTERQDRTDNGPIA